MPTSTSYTTVEDGQPLGKPHFRIESSPFFVKVREEQWEKYVSLLEISVAKYQELEKLLETTNKRFLRNAIDYYYRALGDVTLEEELIDLFISLESMLSLDQQELRLRLSLRTCLLLGRTEKEKREIFNLIYTLYKERSNIVHKGQFKEIDGTDISKLKKLVRKVIVCLINIKLSKKKTIKLIDDSLYDAQKEQELIELIKASEEKWEKAFQNRKRELWDICPI